MSEKVTTAIPPLKYNKEQGCTPLVDLVGNRYPNTELCVDLKLLTREPGRMGIGASAHGILAHDAEDHFTFVEDDAEARGTLASVGERSVEEGASTFEVGNSIAAASHDASMLHFLARAFRSRAYRRNPMVYTGQYVNVHRKPDGTLYPTFTRLSYMAKLTFKDFCREAAEELLDVADLFG